jgi:hypothetical protein
MLLLLPPMCLVANAFFAISFSVFHLASGVGGLVDDDGACYQWRLPSGTHCVIHAVQRSYARAARLDIDRYVTAS